MPGLGEALTQGLSNSLGRLGAFVVGSALPSDQQGGFAQAASQSFQRLEEAREARRAQNQALFQEIVRSNPQAIAGLSPEQQAPFLNALAEPLAEQANIGMPQALEQTSALVNQLAQPEPISPGVALQGAQLGARTGDKELTNRFLAMIDPSLVFSPEEQQDPQAQELMFKLIGDSDNFTIDSRQRFFAEALNNGGIADLSILELDPASVGGSIPDFTNAKAWEAWNLMQGGQEDQVSNVHLWALQQKIKPGLPEGLDQSAALRMYVNWLGVVQAAAVAREGFSLEGATKTFTTALSRWPEVAGTMGVNTLPSPTRTQVLEDLMTTHAQRAAAENEAAWAASRWSELRAQYNDSVSDDQITIMLEQELERLDQMFEGPQ